ncbi:MAG: hypothetical protein F4Z15_10880 [Gammaproteobacteria bacterium]|nr:hypothetical protein [Gammaproteobacteria bacterium]MYD77054.1 hypothetical protein [Gammaproteobacteria bacterium]MYJ53109.1 hypothetical protein [Gammaproteobacteria bacterium]
MGIPSRSPEYDYVIAGGGSAGCVLAARLCEDRSVRVLLVEAGGHGRSLFSRMPAGNGILIGNRHFDWGFESAPQKGMHGSRLYLPRGLGLGGSSLLNGMIYIRGNAKDYDRWARHGIRGWSYAEVLPYFKRLESVPHRTGSLYHGQDGPVGIVPSPNHGRLNRLFVEACVQAGACLSEDFNGPFQLGAARLDSNIRDGIRQSSATAYLSDIPKNLTITTRTRALGIEFDGMKVIGLTLDSGPVRAVREVLVCMGSYGSPQLLMLSGVGPADHLARHGIGVRLDLPGVGSRLYDHPNVPVQYDLFDPDLSLARYQRIDRAAWLLARYLFNRSGPGAGSFWSAMLFHSLQDAGIPDFEVFFTPMVVREGG